MRLRAVLTARMSSSILSWRILASRFCVYWIKKTTRKVTIVVPVLSLANSTALCPGVSSTSKVSPQFWHLNFHISGLVDALNSIFYLALPGNRLSTLFFGPAIGSFFRLVGGVGELFRPAAIHADDPVVVADPIGPVVLDVDLLAAFAANVDRGIGHGAAKVPLRRALPRRRFRALPVREIGPGARRSQRGLPFGGRPARLDPARKLQRLANASRVEAQDVADIFKRKGVFAAVVEQPALDFSKPAASREDAGPVGPHGVVEHS